MTTMKSVAMATVSACALAFAAPHAMAQPAPQAEGLQQFEFNIPSQPLPDALMTLSEQSKQTVLASPRLTEGQQSDAVSGAYTVPQALAKILMSSGLKYRQRDAQTWLVTAQLADAIGISPKVVLAVNSSGDPRLIRVTQISEQDEEEPPTEENERKRPRDEIIVTGTNIRGIAPDSSPSRTFTREDIQISGAATAQDFIQTLTTNFGGGSNAGIFGLPNDSNATFNNGANGTLGSSVNLRGLGSGSTLVLLNGHRLAPSSGVGDFVDISMIPASAIERVEVLTDGASSIYGGDAVAGVTNFVLREDFDGMETSLRYGIGTQHRSAEEFRASGTGGLNWDSGHALVSYEYFNQDAVGAQDRTFSEKALLPNDLLPSNERHSVLASVSQELSSRLEVFGDFMFAERESARDNTNSSGDTSRQIPSSKSFTVSGGGAWKIENDWILDISATYSDLHSEPTLLGSSPVMRMVDSDIWTLDAKTSGTVLSLPGGNLKLALGGHYRSESFTNFNVISDQVDRQADRDVYAAFGEAFIPIVGPGNAIPGIERLELNVSGRFDDYSDFGSTANPKVGVLWSPFEAVKLRGSYSTSFTPPPLGRIGATDFSASAIRTSFWNSIFGLTPADPSIADVVVITASGTSKSLDAENSRAITAGVDFNRKWRNHTIVFSTTYFNIDYKNRLGSTPVPDSRIFFDAPNIAFNNPDLFPEGSVIFSPSQDQILEIVDSVDRPFPPAGGLFQDPFDAEIINLVPIVRNLVRTKVSGFDFDFAYAFDSSAGTFLVGMDGTFLQDYQQQAALTTPSVEQVNTLFNPVDLKLRARAGYAHNGFAANMFVNFTGDYHLDSTTDALPIDSWTTIDLSLSYEMRDGLGTPILSNSVVRLSALNVLDEDPPFQPSNPGFFVFGFDPTNASPLGRFIAFEITKSF